MTLSKTAVMLVEDDPAILKLTSRILESLGYTVLKACNGTEALAAYHEHRAEIGVVLTDIQMPDISGRELAEHLRNDNAELPIVFVSGYAQDQLSEDNELDNVYFIQKPFNKAKLHDIVTHALSEKV